MSNNNRSEANSKRLLCSGLTLSEYHAGSPEVVEIRANTVWAVELIRQELYREGKGLNAVEIDWILWNLGRQSRPRKKHYHPVVTIFY